MIKQLIYFIGCGLLIILYSTSCKTKQTAPKEDFSFKHYQSISLDYKDSLVQFHISENPEEIETDFSKEYYWFKIDKIGSSQGHYTGKLLDGEYKVIRQEDKVLICKGDFEEGLKSGQWIRWYPNGKISTAYNYDEGQKNGSFLIQNRLGQPLEKGLFAKGKLDGAHEFYRADTIFKTIKYKKGIPIDTIP